MDDFNDPSAHLAFFVIAGCGFGIDFNSGHSIVVGSYPIKYPATPVHTNQIINNTNSKIFLNEDPFSFSYYADYYLYDYYYY